MPQISPRSAAEMSIHGPEGRRLLDRELEVPDRERDEPDLAREDLDRDRLLVLPRLDERPLLERDVDGVRLIVLRFAIAQMFSLVALLYHVRSTHTRRNSHLQKLALGPSLCYNTE